jgi:hypothetical protein
MVECGLQQMAGESTKLGQGMTGRAQLEKKTARELEQLILNEVRDLPVCQGLDWISIVPVQTTWRVDMCGGNPMRQAECTDAINSVVSRLRALYDLSPEDAAAHTKRGEMTARAEKLADEAIDRLLTQSDQPKAVKAKRKRRLTKLPAELK